MAVLGVRELAGRTLSHRFGEPPTAEVRFAITLDTPDTPQQQIFNSVNIKHGDVHPEYTYLRCVEGIVAENDPDPWHATATYRYELPQRGNTDFEPNPLARPDVWSFSTGGSQVPALVCFEGDGNGTKKPLVNSAGDFFEGILADESEIRATISGNRAAFPLSTASVVTNAINDSSYLGGEKHTWKCTGLSAQQQTELVNDEEINYWQVSVELVYRQSGWNLLLPNVGFNYYWFGTAKRAVWVYDEDGNRIVSTTPQPLNSDGTLKYPGAPGEPDILTRRINPEVDFNLYFGTPPF